METSPTAKKRSQSISVLVFSIALVVIIVIIATQDMKLIEEFIRQSGAWGVIVSICVYAALGMTPIPSEPLTLFIGALFGPYMGLFIAGTGNTLSALVEYYLGMHIGNATNFIESKEKLPWGLGKLKVENPLFLVGARMVPGVGPKVVSFTAGIYRVPILRYLWTSALSVYLGAALFAFGGSGLKTLFPK